MILVNRVFQEHEYIRVVDCGKPISQAVHDWAREYSEQYSVNIVVAQGSAVQIYTTDPEFRDAMSSVYNSVG